MKKTLIAIAALAATGAFAQSTVTIDGVVDAGYASYNYKGIGVSGVDRNLSSTSQINFRVNSDLGGGMRLQWRSETDFVPTSNGANTGTTANTVGATGQTAANTGTGSTNGTATTFMNGEQLLALTTGFGQFKFGAINNGALNVTGTSQPFGTAIGSGFRATSGSFVTPDVRGDNSFQYVSPTFGGGFSIATLVRKQQAQAQAATATGYSTNYNSSLGAQGQSQLLDWVLNYNAGPLNATLVRATQDSTNLAAATAGTGAIAIPATAGKGVYTGLAANYNFGAATVFGGYQLNKAAPYAAANIVDRQTLTIGARYVAGVHTFMGAYQRASNNLPNAVGTTSNGQTSSASASNLIGLGYEYGLSKTAALTARYERLGDSANLANSATAGQPFVASNNASDRTRMGVGLRLSF